MLKERVITAIVLLLILLGAYWAGPVWFSAVMAVGFFLAQWEWFKLARVPSWIAGIVAAIIGLTTCATVYTIFAEMVTGQIDKAFYNQVSGLFILYIAIVTLLWLGIAIGIYFSRNKGMKVATVFVSLTAVFFAPAAWLCFVSMYASFGISMILSLLMIVWIADIMAYFTGRAFGKHRLAPAISPKKSWEGVAGGMLSVFVLGLIAAWCVPEQYHTLPGLLVSKHGLFGWAIGCWFLVTLSIAGDLFESALKRQVGVKDSSNLLPGHGGFYDRMDAMMPTLPAGLMVTVLVASGML
ncbi:MAG TPA: phosphatidate cytidylyltransferase [Candidatus Aphodousia faecipullorum]|nr:phosphatidate cytidylyltransferase [Candidatus Aphodousia faecipullorum]